MAVPTTPYPRPSEFNIQPILPGVSIYDLLPDLLIVHQNDTSSVRRERILRSAKHRLGKFTEKIILEEELKLIPIEYKNKIKTTEEQRNQETINIEYYIKNLEDQLARYNNPISTQLTEKEIIEEIKKDQL